MALKRVTPGKTDTTLVTGKKIDYKDIDLSFSAKPGSINEDGKKQGDVYKKVDTAAVIQAVENVLLTDRLEKPFNPNYGANLRSMLFDMVETYSEELVRRQIIRALNRDEPRVTVTDVKFYDGNRLVNSGAASIFDRDSLRNTVAIIVEFEIDNSQGQFSARVNLNRLR
jgi:phage baseplate assembly protein W